MPEMPNQPPLPSSSPPAAGAAAADGAATATATASYQGVLYKRRDVFKRRWNPRWFVLEPVEGVLTYYRVRSASLAAAAANVTTAPPTAIHDMQRSQTPPPPLLAQDNNDQNARTLTLTPTSSPVRSSGGGGVAVTCMPLLRHRSNSFDSNDSDGSGGSDDYDDAVPRGMIHLRGGCTIVRNDALSRPDDNYFVFTIQRPAVSAASSATTKSLHLAARSEELRNEWMNQLHQVVVVSTALDPAAVAAAAASTGHHQRSSPKKANDNVDATSPSQLRDPSSTPTAPLISPHTAWRCMEDDSRYDQLPDSLQQRLHSLLDDYLPLCEQDIHCKEYGWQKLVPLRQDHKTGNTITAVQRKQPDGSMLMRSDAILPNTSPWALLSLVMDPSRAPDVDPAVRSAKFLHVYNPHTFLDWYAYHPVWPTAGREFTFCSHWQVLHQLDNDNGGGDGDAMNKNGPEMRQDNSKGDMMSKAEPAVLICSFSCPEAEAAQGPVTPNHVRGNLVVLMYLLQPLSSSSTSTSSTSTTTVGCRVTRLASIDLGGSVSQSLSNMVLTKQANLPVTLAEFLQKQQPSGGGGGGTSPPPLVLPWSNAVVSEQVFKPMLGDAFVRPSPPQAADDDTSPPSQPHVHFSSTLTGRLVSPNAAWRSLDDTNACYSQVPDSLKQRLQSLLDQYLPLCEQDIQRKEYAWQKLVPLRQETNGNTFMAVQRKQPDGSMLLRADAVLPHTNPWALLSLLMDPSRKTQMETTVRCAQRLRVYNPHTFLDWYAYHAVWPTAAREFTVCAHWQVLHRMDHNGAGGNNDQKIPATGGEMLPAILTCSFSCPEAEAAQGPVTPNHVRGNLVVSMFLIQPLSSSSTSTSTTTVGCRLTRLASIDLGGSVSQGLSNTVLTKQANLPAVLAAYLESSGGGPKITTSPPPLPSWSNAIVSEQIMKPILGDDAFVQRPTGMVTTTTTTAAAAAKVSPAAARRRHSTAILSSPPQHNSSPGDDNVVHEGDGVVKGTRFSSTGTATDQTSPVLQAVVVCVPVIGYYILFLRFGFFGMIVLVLLVLGMAALWSTALHHQSPKKSC